jgi:hypothetical protein
VSKGQVPNFLVIGAQRSATTWLHKLLSAHPQVFVPSQRKEVNFFNLNYDRGYSWYRAFFPSENRISNYIAVGEISPDYMFRPETALRIHTTLDKCRLIAILRNPADRLYSEYGLAVKDYAEKRCFSDYLDQMPTSFRRGLYSEQLTRFINIFPAQQILIILFEELVECPSRELDRISSYLHIKSSLFTKASFETKVNRSYVPKHASGLKRAREIGKALRRNGFDQIVEAAKKMGVRKLFGESEPLPKMDSGLRVNILERYAEDIGALEKLLGRNLNVWRY